VRALELPLERGRAGDLAGIAVDALRTSRPPMDPSERWATAVRLQQPMSIAAAVLTRDTASPEPVLLHHAVRGVRQYGDLDPAHHDDVVRLDDVIPSYVHDLASGQNVRSEEYADRVSALGAEFRTALGTRSLSVGDVIAVAETALAVSDAGRRIYLAGGMPALSEEARAGAHGWTMVARAARLRRPVLASTVGRRPVSNPPR
jgi:hypothetical protein